MKASGAIIALALALLGAAVRAAPVDLEFDSEEERGRDDTAVLEAAQESGVYRLRVRYVKVEGRWANRVPVPLAAGEILTPEKLSAAMNALRATITSAPASSLALRSKGEVGVLYIDVKFDTGPEADANGVLQPAPETVGVIFRPFYVHISLVQIGNNVLPIPRSALPTFYGNVPEWLLALNPVVGASYDRAFGPAMSLGVATDLFQFVPSADDRQHLDLRADGTKSLDESFYRASGAARYSVRQNSGGLREFAVAADFDAVEEPLGDATHTRAAGTATLGVKLKLAPNVRLALDAGYRRTDDELEEFGITTGANANQQVGRVLLDMIPPRIEGFLRAALWQENAWQTGDGSRAYQRIVGRIGYEKEISLGSNQTIGIEVIAGGGSASGNTPSFARFFGGNPRGQFLYDAPEAGALMTMPAGPIIRSLGENQARLRGPDRFTSGGDTFWHANLNVTIPIRSWSRSLIPNELTDLEDADGKFLSIKQLLKRQIEVTGPSMLAAVLKNEGLSDAEATRRARQILQEVTPATRFIIEDANLYSLKPLLMFDAAGLSDRGGRSETWLAAGGGLQFTIVTAKLEAGYMHTLTGPTFGHRGNAFVRLVFQNLF